MNTPTWFWIVIRVLIVVANIWGIGFYHEGSNIDLTACALISGVFFVALFFWLVMSRSRENVDWSKPFALTQPFIPMRRSPLRFWFVLSVSFTAGGAVAVARSLIGVSREYVAFGGMFISLGIAIIAAIFIWLRLFGSPAKLNT